MKLTSAKAIFILIVAVLFFFACFLYFLGGESKEEIAVFHDTLDRAVALMEKGQASEAEEVVAGIDSLDDGVLHRQEIMEFWILSVKNDHQGIINKVNAIEQEGRKLSFGMRASRANSLLLLNFTNEAKRDYEKLKTIPPIDSNDGLFAIYLSIGFKDFEAANKRCMISKDFTNFPTHLPCARFGQARAQVERELEQVKDLDRSPAIYENYQKLMIIKACLGDLSGAQEARMQAKENRSIYTDLAIEAKETLRIIPFICPKQMMNIKSLFQL